MIVANSRANEQGGAAKQSAAASVRISEIERAAIDGLGAYPRERQIEIARRYPHLRGAIIQKYPWLASVLPADSPPVTAGPAQTSYNAGPVPATPDLPADQSDQMEQIAVKVDAELARLAVALNHTAEFRLWTVARYYDETGSGDVGIETLHARMHALGIKQHREHTNRLLRNRIFFRGRTQGHGDNKRVFLAGYEAVAVALVNEAIRRGLPALVATNRPGKSRPVFIPVAHKLTQFEANIYAAWYAMREDPTISRATLADLWNRTRQTLWNWEQKRLKEGAVTVTVKSSYIQTDKKESVEMSLERGRAFVYHIYKYVGKRTWRQRRIRWRGPNQYTASGIRQHPHRGMAGSVRRAVNTVCRNSPTVCDGGDTLNKQYFTSRERLQAAQKRRGDDRTMYLFLGHQEAVGNIWEPTATGYTSTSAADYTPAFDVGSTMRSLAGKLGGKSWQ